VRASVISLSNSTFHGMKNRNIWLGEISVPEEKRIGDAKEKTMMSTPRQVGLVGGEDGVQGDGFAVGIGDGEALRAGGKRWRDDG